MVGVQGQIHSAAGLALGNRVRDLTMRKFEEALYRRRTLVKLWGQRNTLHAYRSTDWPLITAAFRNLPTWLERAIAREHVDDAPYRALLRALERRLAEGGTIGRADMRAMRMAPNEEWLTWGGAMMRLVRDGVVCQAQGEGSETRFAHREHWVPGLRWHPPATPDAQRHVISRYVGTYGPATVQDVAYWLGLRIPEAQAWVDLAAQELMDVEVEGVSRLALRADRRVLKVPAPARSRWPIKLLYRFDPLLLGLKAKEWIVANEHYMRVWRPGGHIEGVILVRDRVQGTWRYDRSKGGLTVTLRPFARLPNTVLRIIRARASGVARFLDMSLVKVAVR